MSKRKIFIAAMLAAVCIAATPTAALADSPKENIDALQTNGNPLMEVLTLLGVIYAASEYGDLQSRPRSLQPQCSGLQSGAQCWKELANRPGCFVWEEHLNVTQTLTWSGECDNGIGNGIGTLVRADNESSYEQVGTITDGKQNGYWTYRDSAGDVAEGPYVDGRQHGQWTYRYANGTVAEGPYVHGKLFGHWRFHYGDGTVAEGRLRGDRRYGYWQVRHADGKVEWL